LNVVDVATDPTANVEAFVRFSANGVVVVPTLQFVPSYAATAQFDVPFVLFTIMVPGVDPRLCATLKEVELPFPVYVTTSKNFGCSLKVHEATG
jgi:hypothetical protein